MPSIVQDWVADLGLRHQGGLMTAVRGCDSVPKEDASKSLVRSYRSYILTAFGRNPLSFIEFTPLSKLRERMQSVANNFDHYPIHFVLHLVQAAEIVGYHHPETLVRQLWLHFYTLMCHKMHLQPESKEALDTRLYACETVFVVQG